MIVTPYGAPLSIAPQGRLTFSSANPTPVIDIVAAGTLYFEPYIGDLVSIWNGSVWKMHEFSSLSAAVPANANLGYDVFIIDNSGTRELVLTPWADLSIRVVSVVRFQGRYTKNGDPKELYLGSFRTGSASQGYDSAQRRWLWNYYNRIDAPLSVIDGTDNWEYTTDSFRQANGNTNNYVSTFVGIEEDRILVEAKGYSFNNNGTVKQARTTGIGINSTTVNSAHFTGEVEPGFSEAHQSSAIYSGFATLGYTQFNWLEKSDDNVAGTTTWFGDNFSGMTGVTKR